MFVMYADGNMTLKLVILKEVSLLVPLGRMFLRISSALCVE